MFGVRVSGGRGAYVDQDRYRELEVWRKAYALALRVYRATADFPSEERFGLVQQLRRASVGVFANIAEGHARGSRKEYMQFCTVARGSQTETQALLLLSKDLGFLKVEVWRDLDENYRGVGQMLNKLISALRHSH